MSDFRRRTGKGGSPGARRGACIACRRTTISSGHRRISEVATEPSRKMHHEAAISGTKQSKDAGTSSAQIRPIIHHGHRQVEHAPSGLTDPGDARQLHPTRQGTIRMRGRTDQGRRWQQEIDPALARILVEQHAAIVVNRHTIRRLFSNKDFKQYIFNRDQYICWFCGNYGDTIDHLHPRAKGGHTTPVNCVCACNVCNQIKADRDLHEFLREMR